MVKIRILGEIISNLKINTIIANKSQPSLHDEKKLFVGNWSNLYCMYAN